MKTKLKYRVAAAAASLTLLLSGCTFADSDFDIFSSIKNQGLFGEFNKPASDISGVEDDYMEQLPSSSAIDSDSADQAEDVLAENASKALWDYGDSGTDIKPISPYDYYGRNKLSVSEREIYDSIVAAVIAHQEEIKIKRPVNSDTAVKILNYVLLDYPQFFWIDEKYSIYSNDAGEVISYKLVYSLNKKTSETMLAKLKIRAKEMLSGIDSQTPDFYKALTIHNRIIDFASYDQTASLENSYNLYGILIEGKGVCQGYAKAYQYLLYMAGMQSLYVKGTSKNQPHAWNMVMQNGEYYNIDITWDDPVFVGGDSSTNQHHSYFNLTDSEITIDHSFNTKENYPLPSCTATDNNYFVKYNIIFENFFDSDLDRLAQSIAYFAKNKSPAITIKLDYQNNFNDLYDWLMADDVIFAAMNKAVKTYGASKLDTKRISVSTVIEQKTVSISFYYNS